MREQHVITDAIMLILATVCLVAGVRMFSLAATTSPAAELTIVQPAAAPVVRVSTPAQAKPRVTRVGSLSIPAIGVYAPVQAVGLTARGAIAVPTNSAEVGWYAQGPVPGEMGNAIIDGHVDTALGLSGVFRRLGELKPGDEIFFTKADGTQVKFRVSVLNHYPYQQVPVSEVFAPAGPARLRLITCAGTWLPSEQTYDQRLIVTAELVHN